MAFGTAILDMNFSLFWAIYNAGYVLCDLHGETVECMNKNLNLKN